MTTTLDFVFFLLAVILFVLAVINAAGRQMQLLAAGLVAFALPFLIAAWPGH